MADNEAKQPGPDKILLFEVDEDAVAVPYTVPGQQWDKACAALSGEGAETQLVNALDALGIEAYARLGDE
jgi:hypothetical protein